MAPFCTTLLLVHVHTRSFQPTLLATVQYPFSIHIRLIIFVHFYSPYLATIHLFTSTVSAAQSTAVCSGLSHS